MTKKKFLCFLVCMSSLLNFTAAQPGQNENKDLAVRFAISVGANHGGPDRIKLKYAESDARSLLKVFGEMGGVYKENKILLSGTSRKTLFSEIEKLKQNIKKARSKYKRVEMIFYYSGHSDDEHILLNKEKISYKDVRESLAGLETDVSIVILDSCASGAFTRIKGGKKKLPFLIDTAYNMKGSAVLTSSSSDEVAQESDRIKGSFFTHYLISGLRGAADLTHDGRITLNEAYLFAFNETLVQTEKTKGGPQHPRYEIQMSGTGDVVLTAIRESSAVCFFQ